MTEREPSKAGIFSESAGIRERLMRLLRHPGVRRYGFNTSWLLGEKVIRIIAALVVGIWVARYLGPEQFGVFSYAYSFSNLFTSIAGLGIAGIVIRELVQNNKPKTELLGTAFVIILTGGFTVLLIISIGLLFMNHDSNVNLMILVMAGAAPFQAFTIADMHFQSEVQSKFPVYAGLFSLTVSSIIKILLILFQAPLAAFAWVVFLDGLTLAGGQIFLFYRKSGLTIRSLYFKKETAKELLKDSWPLVFSGIASMINMRIDQVMLGSMADFHVVGNYAAAVRVSEVWLILPGLIGSSIYPAIIAAKQKSQALYKSRVRMLTFSMLIFAVPFALTVGLLSDFIIWILYGNQFTDAGIYLSIHIWSGLPYVGFFVLAKVAIIEKLTTISLYSSVFTVIINIVLNLILIPHYSGLGAAAATLAAAWGSGLLSLILIEKRVKIFRYGLIK